MQSRIRTALLICLCAPTVCAAQSAGSPLLRWMPWRASDEEQVSAEIADKSEIHQTRALQPAEIPESRPSRFITRRQLLQPDAGGPPFDTSDPSEVNSSDAAGWSENGAGASLPEAESIRYADPMPGSGRRPLLLDDAPLWAGPPVGLTPAPPGMTLPALPPQSSSFSGAVFTPDPPQPVVAAPLFGTVLHEEIQAVEHPPVPWSGRMHDCVSGCEWWFKEKLDCFLGKGECDNPWRRLFDLGAKESSFDVGIGRERVALAPFEIDLVQPFNNFRLRYDSVYNMRTPDRAAYFWAKSGTGPPSVGERVDYQDLRLYSEIGGGMASAFTEVPLRSLDPEFNSNTTGLGDMTAGGKVLLVDGTYWKIAQITKTHLNTGSVRKGLGRGHVAIEPGVLGRYKWNEETYLHGQFTFWFPVGADKAFAGQILRYGVGVSHLGCETDRFALIHTAEVTSMTFIDGQETTLLGIRDLDGETVTTWLYGMRAVLGPAGDLGLFEVGLAGGFGTGSDWIDGLMRMELRWSY